MESVNILIDRQREMFEKRGFQKNFTPGVRRQQIQDRLQIREGIIYSDGGFRGRLKKLVEKGALEKDHIFDRVSLYRPSKKREG